MEVKKSEQKKSWKRKEGKKTVHIFRAPMSRKEWMQGVIDATFNSVPGSGPTIKD